MSQSEPVPPKPPITEELLFAGSPSWIGRLRAFAITWILVLLLVIVPTLAAIYATAFPWWLTVFCVIAAIALVVLQLAYHRTIRFRITNYRVDFERGLLTRRIDSLELWHADDLFFRQSLMERMMGVGNIDIIAKDKSSPRLELMAIPDARNVFEKLKSAILAAKRQRGILELDQ